MDKQTREVLSAFLKTQDALWKKAVIYVVDWLIYQGFKISYKY